MPNLIDVLHDLMDSPNDFINFTNKFSNDISEVMYRELIFKAILDSNLELLKAMKNANWEFDDININNSLLPCVDISILEFFLEIYSDLSFQDYIKLKWFVIAIELEQYNKLDLLKSKFILNQHLELYCKELLLKQIN